MEEVIRGGGVLEDRFLFETPFEETAGGPVGNVALGDGEADFVEGGDDVFIGDGVPEHAANHVAFEFGEAGDAAIAADFARVLERGGVLSVEGWSGQGFSVDEGVVRR